MLIRLFGKNVKMFSRKSTAPIILFTLQAIFITMLCVFNFAYADIMTNNLSTEIQSGNVSMDKIEGTGGSSGTVLNGYLINNTKKEINVNVFLRDALHLINSGSGQNMFVLGVLGKSGQYIRSGNKSFIKLPPKKRFPVTFLSYCANFGKDNPIQGESFEVGALPET